jgi:hypothetical protein
MRPRIVRSPVDICFGAKPSQAAKSRPFGKRSAIGNILTDCEQLFRAQEANKRMKDKAAHACQALRRARVVEEVRLRKGTPAAKHLKLVLNVIDGLRFTERTNNERCDGGVFGNRDHHRSAQANESFPGPIEVTMYKQVVKAAQPPKPKPKPPPPRPPWPPAEPPRPSAVAWGSEQVM